MRDAVGQERVDPRPGGKNLALPHAPGGGIAITRGGDVATKLFHDLPEGTEASHGNSVAPDRRTSAVAEEAAVKKVRHGPRNPSVDHRRTRRQGVKNACEM